MSFLEKVKKSAEQAAETVKGEVQELQIKNEAVRTYEELGRKVVELFDKSELSNSVLRPYVDHVRDLKAKLDAAEKASWDKNKPQPPAEPAP